MTTLEATTFLTASRERDTDLAPQEKPGTAVTPGPAASHGVQPVESSAPRAQTEHPVGFVYDGVRAGGAIRAGLSRRAAASRPLPMEEICFFVKPIDNEDLTRKADERARSAFARWLCGAAILLVLAVAAYGPRAWMRQSGYRLERLDKQHQALLEINHQLQVRKAQLRSLSRVLYLANTRGLQEPPLERIAWQDRTISAPTESQELAKNLPAGAAR